MYPSRTRLTFALLAGTAFCAPGARAVELPTGASVAYGAVGVTTPGAASMVIKQSSPAAIVNWQGFSIGQGGRVDIQQPSAASALLNRVTGSAPSTIAGQLTANGQVYLVNPNGIAITPTGTVKAGAFVASTLDTTNDDFIAGRRIFNGGGRSASVVNQGTIEIGSGGYAALIGGQVDNAGTISVPMGKVGLGAGERATLDLSGDGFLQVTVPSQGGADGALIRQSGTIRAVGGRVELQAATARDVVRNAINMSGVIEARSVGGRSGAIVLGGGEGGRVAVSGRLDTSSIARTRRAERRSARPAKGGDITVTGDSVRLAGATLDASGTGGGGKIRVGGDYQGGGTLQRATTTDIDAATTIRADALRSGDGGNIVVWSDLKTTFDGLISAKGGPQGGNGGDAEVSGKAVLAYNGQADLSAPKGAFGTLLLDPYNVTISTTPDTGETSGPGNQVIAPFGVISGTQFTPSQNDSNINVTTLTNALATANVLVTTGTAGAQAGNITVAAPIAWTAPTNLALNAAGAIFINAPITATTGSFGAQSVFGIATTAALTFAAGGVGLSTGGDINIGGNINAAAGLFLNAGSPGGGGLPATVGGIYPTAAVNVGAFQIQRGNWIQVATTLPAFSAGLFTVAGDGTATSPASFLRAAGGNGTTVAPYRITDVYGLQGIGTSASLLGSSYALANDINAAGTAAWNAGAGFVPIGARDNQTTVQSTTVTPFAGTFDGQNHTISGLTINRPTSNTGTGLFGFVRGPNVVIQNVTLANANVTGSDRVGALIGTVGFGAGSVSTTISNVTVSGRVSGGSNVGGLAGGLNVAPGGTLSVSRAISNAAVNFTTQPAGAGGQAGGLAGNVQTYGGGNISISQSYATGNVTAAQSAGGLVGRVTIGSLADQGGGSADATPRGTISITDSFATGQTQATSGGRAGGLIGRVDTPATTEAGSGVTVASTYAIGNVVQTAGVTTGGLIGGTTGDSSRTVVNSSYFDTQRTGQASSAATGGAGATPQTTAQLQAGLPAGFSPAIWSTGINGQLSYPYLTGIAVPDAITTTTTAPPPPPPPVDPLVAQTAAAQVAVSDTPTLSRQLTLPFFPTLQNVNTVIDINLGGGSGGSGGGPTLGTGNDSGGQSVGATRSSATQTLNSVERSANDLDRALRQCEASGRGYGACVGNALDRFANTLDSQLLTLPPPLRAVAAVIRQAAQGVRAAPTVAAARAVVQSAVAEVRKAIALIRADDPVVGRIQVRQGNVIASALQSVDNRLARAVGL